MSEWFIVFRVVTPSDLMDTAGSDLSDIVWIISRAFELVDSHLEVIKWDPSPNRRAPSQYNFQMRKHESSQNFKVPQSRPLYSPNRIS
jgi:hypothetical protein